jgi:hypothetical protein
MKNRAFLMIRKFFLDFSETALKPALPDYGNQDYDMGIIMPAALVRLRSSEAGLVPKRTIVFLNPAPRL